MLGLRCSLPLSLLLAILCHAVQSNDHPQPRLCYLESTATYHASLRCCLHRRNGKCIRIAQSQEARTIHYRLRLSSHHWCVISAICILQLNPSKGYILLISDPRTGPSYVGLWFVLIGIYAANALVLSWPAENVACTSLHPAMSIKALIVYASQLKPSVQLHWACRSA